VNRQLAMLRAATEAVLPLVLARALSGDFEAQKLILERGLPKLKPVDVPMEFTLPEAGDTAPARAVLVQAAEGALPLSSAEKIVNDLMPVVEREERQAQPPNGFMNTYLAGVMRG
jgi:hypothetical protein